MRKKPVLTAAVLAALTVLMPVGVRAAEPGVRIPAVVNPAIGEAISVEGTLQLRTDLEMPHYEVGDWAIMLDDKALLARLEGKQVQITGKEFKGFSILMRRQLEVTSITTTLEGVLAEVTDLETPHYELDGWVLQGDAATFSAMSGSDVRVTGRVLLGPSIYMKPAVQVSSVAAVSAEQEEAIAVKVRGVLRLEQELEGPHFSVDGWVVKADQAELLAKLVGKYVTIKGSEFTGMSIFMRPQVVVEELEVTLRGSLQSVTDLESPHFELDGFVLLGEAGAMQALSGQTVMVTASLFTGPSIYMRPVLEVKSVQAAASLLPEKVLVAGKAPAFPVAPVLEQGHLMLPLRATVEAAGGVVEWDQAARAVRLTVGERTTTIAIGKAEHAGGKLAVAPYLKHSHTMASFDLFEALGLGLYWEGATLHVLPVPSGSTADR